MSATTEPTMQEVTVRYGPIGLANDTIAVERLLDAVEQILSYNEFNQTDMSKAPWEELFSATSACYERWAERIAVVNGTWASWMAGPEVK
jgi:hypothetical protein